MEIYHKKEYLPVPLAAALLMVKPGLLRQWITRGKLPSIKRGNRRFVRPIDVERLLKN